MNNTNNTYFHPLYQSRTYWMDLADLHPLRNTDPIRYRQACQLLSTTDQKRLALTEWISDYQSDGRTLFHMSVTYQTQAGRAHSEEQVNKYFTTLYVHDLLPYLLNTHSYNRESHRPKQPICLAFIDENKTKLLSPRPSKTTALEPAKTSTFHTSLHHHAILAVHPETLDRMQKLVGLNTLASVSCSSSLMTSDLKPCEPKCLLYASKDFSKYPDFLSFPDRWKTSPSKLRKELTIHSANGACHV